MWWLPKLLINRKLDKSISHTVNKRGIIQWANEPLQPPFIPLVKKLDYKEKPKE